MNQAPPNVHARQQRLDKRGHALFPTLSAGEREQETAPSFFEHWLEAKTQKSATLAPKGRTQPVRPVKLFQNRGATGSAPSRGLLLRPLLWPQAASFPLQRPAPCCHLCRRRQYGSSPEKGAEARVVSDRSSLSAN